MKDTLSKITPNDIYRDTAAELIAEVERKELGRIEKAEWYSRFAYIQDDESYFDMQDRREVSRQTFNALFRHTACKSIHTGRKVEASICFDENRQANGAKALVGVTYAAGEDVIVTRDGDLFGNRWRDARPELSGEKNESISLWMDHCQELVPEQAELDHIFDVNCECIGVGAVGVVAGSRVLLGSPEFLLEHGVELSPIVPMAVSDGMFLVAIDGRFAGMMLMDDA